MDLTLLAQAAPAAPGDFLGSMMVPILLTIVIFYFFLIRPEQRKRKELEAKISALRKHDRVLTSGGIVGTIWSIKDNEIVLQVDDSNKTRIRFVKSAVVTVLAPSKEGKDKDKDKEEVEPVATTTNESKEKPPVSPA